MSRPQPWAVPSFKDVRMFLAGITMAVIILLCLVFLVRYRAVNELLIDTVRHEAESYANLIIVTRHWNAQYGGVYVEKKTGIASNRYLAKVGVPPDVTITDGRVLTLKNPAIMTREISELANRENIVRFHMVSRRPLNPENEPDAFERTALEQLERGERPGWQMDTSAQPPLFRAVLPVVVEEPCLRCHGQQGYRVGDVRGGVSVMVPAGHLQEQIRTNRRQVVTDLLITVGVLLGIVSFLTWKMTVRLEEVQGRLRHMAVTDELTGLHNRRFIMEQLEKEYQRAVRTGSPLSLVLIDIDHFKRINDTFGHAFGDAVLKAVGQEMENALRTYDLLGRIGGEEFLIASPGSTLDDARGLAERIRQRIAGRAIIQNGRSSGVTVSAGVTSMGEQDATSGTLLVRTDEALYLAKQAGRDRVVAL